MPRRPPTAPVSRKPRAAARNADGSGGGRATRARLLRAGLAIAQRCGLRAVAVRAVAARARVNLGSFVYHFGSRDAFIAELIEQWYGPFHKALQLTVDAGAPPRERLRALLAQVADFLAEHRRFIGHVLMDAAAGEPAARRFMRSIAGRHPALVLQAIVDAQRAGELPPAPPLNTMAFLFAAVGGPMVLLGGLADSGLLPAPFASQLRHAVLDPDGARQRIDWALRGLAAAADAAETPRAAGARGTR